MDIATVANLVLVASAVMFISAVAYRIGSAVVRTPRGTTASRAPEAELEPGLKLAEERRNGSLELPTPSMSLGHSASEIVEGVVNAKAEELDEIARGLVDYAVAHGARFHIRPEVLERMARQFAVIVDLEQSLSLPEDQYLRREILREVFTRTALQAKK